MKLPNDEKLNSWLKMALILAAVMVSIFLLADKVMPIVSRFFSAAWPLLLPFILGAVLAMLLEPAISFFETRWHWRRSFAVVAIILFFLVAFFGFFGAIITRLVVEINKLLVVMPDLSGMVDEIIMWVESFYYNSLGSVVDVPTLESLLSKGLQAASDFGMIALEKVLNFLMATPIAVIIFLITLVATYFFCRDKNSAINFIARLFPVAKRPQVLQVWDSTSKAASGYLRSLIILMIMTMVLTIIGLLIVGAEYAFTLGIITGIVDVLPIFGPAAVLVPLAIYHLILGKTGIGIGILIVYGVVTVVHHLAQPLLVSDNIGLHPLWTLAALFVGLQLWGFVGMILLPIVLVVVKSAIKSVKQGS